MVNNVANSKITQPSLIEGYTPKAQTSGISDLGKAGVGIGASVLGEVGGNLISDGFNTVPGTLINQIGSTAGSVISMIPGVGWWVGPAITLGSKLLGGVYNRAFGSEYKDNGATAYTNQLNALNPNGSNEYLANLLASTGVGPRATSRNGWFNHSAERRADRTNTAQDLAFNRFQRGVRDAFGNNNWKQLQYALNDYTTYGAMGGRIKRKKCNCKATGGFLNNAMLDSASATGYNFLSDLTNMQMQNNQNKQDMGSSLGNSFINTSDIGTVFASGGIMIKPENRGKLTRLKKRTGKTEAELYNDGNPEHKKMVVFARNSRRWNKHALGGYLKGRIYDIPEEEVQRLINAGYEVEYL